MTESAPPPLVYRLGDAAARSRARATALLAATASAAPVALVLVLLHRLRYAPAVLLLLGAGIVSLLSGLRAWLVYARLARRLRAFEVAIDDEAMVVDTEGARLTVPREALARLVEMPGALGGIRVQLAAKDDATPERVDVPRGGERFGELRARLAAWRPIERAPRRSRAAWIAIALALVAAAFFLPFVVDDLVARSRLAVLAFVLLLWAAMRWMMARR